MKFPKKPKTKKDDSEDEDKKKPSKSSEKKEKPQETGPDEPMPDERDASLRYQDTDQMGPTNSFGLAPHPFIIQYPLENPDAELVSQGDGPPFSGAADSLSPSRRGKFGDKAYNIPIQEDKERKRRLYWFYRINEVITNSTSLEAIIHDIVHSKNPKFDGKTKKQRINIALGIFYKKHPSGKLDEDSLQSLTDSAREFLSYATAYLDLDHVPKIRFRETKPGETFATWCPEEITIAVTNRHPMDVFRSLAHELVHQKQHENDVLHAESGQTGSEHENEANAIAGILMRNFAKLNPDFFGLPAINESKFSWQIGLPKDRKPNYAYKKQSKKPEKGIRETKALINKSQESGFDYQLLSEVYDRGIQEWSPKYRITREQFAFGRVNSFIAGGKARELDKDLLENE